MKKRTENDSRPQFPMPPPLAAELAEVEAGQQSSLRCRVCGNPGASKRYDMLCWVCRRLKISAWKDVEKTTLPE